MEPSTQAQQSVRGASFFPGAAGGGAAQGVGRRPHGVGRPAARAAQRGQTHQLIDAPHRCHAAQHRAPSRLHPAQHRRRGRDGIHAPRGTGGEEGARGGRRKRWGGDGRRGGEGREEETGKGGRRWMRKRDTDGRGRRTR
jgi:hypothetical protein